jgi:hypothetical protein
VNNSPNYGLDELLSSKIELPHDLAYDVAYSRPQTCTSNLSSQIQDNHEKGIGAAFQLLLHFI